MTNIRERFEEEFKNLPGRWEDIASFFKSELEMLAQQIETLELDGRPNFMLGGLKDAAYIIRTKASELVNEQ